MWGLHIEESEAQRPVPNLPNRRNHLGREGIDRQTAKEGIQRGWPLYHLWQCLLRYIVRLYSGPYVAPWQDSRPDWIRREGWNTRSVDQSIRISCGWEKKEDECYQDTGPNMKSCLLCRDAMNSVLAELQIPNSNMLSVQVKVKTHYTNCITLKYNNCHNINEYW